MRRGTALKVLQAKDICLFCSFRPRSQFRPRASQLPHGRRQLSSSCRLLAGQATAIKQDEDDGNDFNLLRQNAELAKAFPSRSRPKLLQTQATESVESQQSSQLDRQQQQTATRNVGHDATQSARNQTPRQHDQFSGRQFNSRRQDGSTQDNRRSGSNGGTTYTKTFKPTPDSEPSPGIRDRNDFTSLNTNRNWREGTNFSRQLGQVGSELDDLILGGSRSSQQDRQTRPRQSRFDAKQNMSRGGFENILGNTGRQNSTPFSNVNRSDRRTQNQKRFGQDTADVDVLPIRKAATNKGVQPQPSDWRPMQARPEGQGSNNFASRNASKGGVGGTQQNRRGPQSTRQSSSRDADAPVDAHAVVDAPAGSSFESSLDEFGRHKRRDDKKDKRSRRSDRFGEDDHVQASETSRGKGSKGRDRAFDFEAWEAEELLNTETGGRSKKKEKKPKVPVVDESIRPTLQLPEFISVEKLARLLKVSTEKFVVHLEEEGFEGARYDHVLDSGTSAMFADIYGFEPVIAGSSLVEDLVARPLPEDVSELPPRPPIVTIMGHVDHGKTTILDFLRRSSVVATEHGGITQHIGAFSVTMPGTNRQITFLDTPGHAAFLEMRRRGANVTDIVVLVVAADDSVKPQTIEAIKHALDAKVQIIVAINKVDKEDANIDRVKQDLARHDIVVEDYGGEYQVIPVSGKTGQGMTDLEEAIITLADVNDFRAEVDGPAEGSIIESKVTQAGRIATVLVRRGTLRPGDFIVAGPTWARVRTLRNDAGVLVTEAPPGMPVQIDGWRGEDPTAGLEVLQADSEQQAKEVVDLRLEIQEAAQSTNDMTAYNSARTAEAEARAKVLAWEAEQAAMRDRRKWRQNDNEGWIETPEDASGPKKVHFVVKADVAGSVEAVVSAISAIGNNEIAANVIHSGTGELTESDIRRLATTGEAAYAVNFNQPVESGIRRLAEAAGLVILDHNIIYRLTDEVKVRLSDELPPLVTQRVIGEAEIGQIFDVTIKKKKSRIAGCKVTNGTITRSNKIRVIRGDKTVFTGNLSSLKNVKKDVTEMKKGTECGLAFEEWEDFQEGDQVQSFEEHEEKQKLY